MPDSLNSRAILVTLELCKPGFDRKDRRITAKVITENKASRNAGRFTKHIVPPDTKELRALANYDKQLREDWFARETSPFSGDLRLLDLRNFDAFFDAFSARWRPGREAVVSQLKDAYQGANPPNESPAGPLILLAQEALGDMFSPSDYPPVATFDFSCRLTPLPVPSSGHLAVELASEIASDGEAKIAALRQQMDALSQRVTAEARADLAVKLAQPLVRLADRKKWSAQADAALWAGLSAVCDLVVRCNVTRDPLLASLGKQVAELQSAHAPDTLHADESAREKARSTAAAILERMKPIVAE